MAVSLLPLPRPGLLLCTWLIVAPQLAAAQAPAPATPKPEASAKPPEAPPASDVKSTPDVKPAPALAAAPIEPPVSSRELGAAVSGLEEEPESLGWTLVRTLFVLGAVVASIYLTLNVGLRKLMGLPAATAGRQSLVSVVERVPLDPRRTLFVLKAADEYLLVGGGEEGLQLLSKLDTAAVERIRAERPPAPNVIPLTPFLQKLLTRRTGSQPPNP